MCPILADVLHPLTSLIDLDGVGPEIGAAIIGSRPFGRVEELIRVSGIGPKRFASLVSQGLFAGPWGVTETGGPLPGGVWPIM